MFVLPLLLSLNPAFSHSQHGLEVKQDFRRSLEAQKLRSIQNSRCHYPIQVCHIIIALHYHRLIVNEGIFTLADVFRLFASEIRL